VCVLETISSRHCSHLNQCTSNSTTASTMASSQLLQNSVNIMASCICSLLFFDCLFPVKLTVILAINHVRPTCFIIGKVYRQICSFLFCCASPHPWNQLTRFTRCHRDSCPRWL